MKTLVDNTGVASRVYYYLLDWNDRDNWEYMTAQFDKTKLHELTIKEFTQLFKYASTEDFRDLKEKVR